MASKNQDALLWLGLCIFGFYATHIAHRQLLAVRAASQITKEEKPPELITQYTEDALKLDTLRELANGSNQEIRNAAIRIITERASCGATYEILLQDISGSNVKRRNKALTSLKFLTESPAREAITHYSTFQALIDCLCNLLEATRLQPVTKFDTTLEYRTQPERDALTILNRTMYHKVPDVLRAGVVSRWLSKYPFGGCNSTESTKREVIQRIKTEDSEDMAMHDILYVLDGFPEGRKQLRNHGLVGSAIDECDDNIDGDIIMAHGEDTAGSMVGGLMRAGRRIREESLEEQALRRRRREAMVLSDGGRPLGRDNIIQREDITRNETELSPVPQAMVESMQENSVTHPLNQIVGD